MKRKIIRKIINEYQDSIIYIVNYDNGNKYDLLLNWIYDNINCMKFINKKYLDQIIRIILIYGSIFNIFLNKHYRSEIDINKLIDSITDYRSYKINAYIDITHVDNYITSCTMTISYNKNKVDINILRLVAILNIVGTDLLYIIEINNETYLYIDCYSFVVIYTNGVFIISKIDINKLIKNIDNKDKLNKLIKNDNIHLFTNIDTTFNYIINHISNFIKDNQFVIPLLELSLNALREISDARERR